MRLPAILINDGPRRITHHVCAVTGVMAGLRAKCQFVDRLLLFPGVPGRTAAGAMLCVVGAWEKHAATCDRRRQ